MFSAPDLTKWLSSGHGRNIAEVPSGMPHPFVRVDDGGGESWGVRWGKDRDTHAHVHV